MTTAAIYCRISKDAAHDGLGVERQRADCEALAERLGWNVTHAFTDDDLSAYSGKPRPAYRQLLDAIETGAVDALVAWHPDRLHRSPRELETFIDLVERTRTAVQTCTAGQYDLTTPTGRMQARIVGNVARFESEHKSERIMRKMDELTAAGQPHVGGTRPFGYRRAMGADGLPTRPPAYEIVPAEAELIQEAAAALLDGGRSLASVVADWRARGVKTPAGGPWSPRSLARMLQSAQLAGLRERHVDRDPKLRAARKGAVTLTPSTVPPILSRERWQALRGLLRDPDRRTARSNARVNLLSGWLRCGRCGHALRGHRDKGGTRKYICPTASMGGCGRLSVLADPTDAEVVGRVLAAIDSPELREAAATSAPSDPLGERAEVEARMAELAAAYAAGGITSSEWQASRAVLADRLAALPAAPRPAFRLPDNLAHAWDGLDLDTRRRIIGEIVESVIVAPARGRHVFDPGRITVNWRA